MNNYKTIIIDSYLKEELISSLLNKNQTISEIDILDSHSFLSNKTKTKDDYNNQFIQIYNRLQENKNDLEILKNSVEFPFFTSEIISFLNNIYTFKIELDELPEETKTQKELKKILQSISDIPFSIKKQIDYLNDDTKLENTLIISSLPFNEKDQEIKRLLINKNAEVINPLQNKLKNVKYYIAQNKRQEVESIAQYLINNNIKAEDCRIILGDTTYADIIYRIFDRYQIPYQTNIDNSLPNLILKYNFLISYLHDRNTLYFHNIFLNRCFGYQTPNINKYLKAFHIRSIEELLEPFPNGRTNSEKILIENVKKEFELIKEDLILLKDCSNDIFSIAICAYKIVCHQLFNQIDHLVIIELKKFLENNLQNINNYDLLSYLVTNINISRKTNFGAFITTIEKSATNNYLYTFVLGINNIPNYHFFNGIFDEDYYCYLSKYPNKQQRYQNINEQIEKSLSLSENLIISKPLADYQGKSVDLNVFWESYLLKHLNQDQIKNKDGKEEIINTLWSLIENNNIQKYPHTINSDNINELILKNNNQLYGSISSFENYFNCPYKYFLGNILKIKELEYGINNNDIGNILHHLVEKLVSDYQKDYPNQESDIYLKYLDDELKDYYDNYRFSHDLLDVSKERIEKHLLLSLKYLKNLEKFSKYSKSDTERKFKTTIKTDSCDINLEGSVDRLDYNDDSFRIIDYKSSSKELSDSKIAAGLSLQLLTYLIKMKEELNLSPDGCYYYTFETKNINTTAGTFNKKKQETTIFDEKDWNNLYLKNNALNGFNFKEVEANMTEFINNSKVKEYEKYYEIIMEVYNHLAAQLRAGQIEPKPVEENSIKNACSYCQYRGICRYKGEYISINEASIIKKEDKDDQMG